MRSVALGLLAALAVSGPAVAADPWAIPADTATALRDPDRFAWQMFVALTWPADPGSRAPATDRAYGNPGPVVFETWALSDQTFLPRGAQPPAWNDIPWAAPRNLGTRAVPRQVALFRQVDPVPPGSANHQQEEIRLNRPAFDYVRDNRLYSIEGQEFRFINDLPVNFPADAIEVKAVWRPIREEDKARYQWAAMKDPKSGKMFNYGLTALHVASKVLPHWFWATFEHVDNPYRNGIHDEGWLNPSRDSVACPPEHLDCNLPPQGFGLQGTRWEFYRLRGTQVDYIDAAGRPVILGNSELETGFQPSASCMSCHARSTIGPMRNDAARFAFGPDAKAHPPSPPEPMRLPVFRVAPDGQVTSFNGPPDPATLLLPGQAAGGVDTYLPLDFVWSLIEAQSETAAPPPPPAR
jgi:hypothetical protein